MLPPPQCLASVPVFPSQAVGPVFSTPALPTVTSWTSPPFSTPPSSWGMWPHPRQSTSAGSQPGLTLSPAAETFPQRLVEKVRSLQFVEMKELLTDNVSLLNQLETVQGSPMGYMLGPTRPHLREVSSLSTWCYCFLAYVAMLTSDPQTRDQLAYARLLIKEAQRHGGAGWLDYDRAFRQQAAGDPSIRWNTLVPGLQASTILGQRSSGQGPFCTLCREADHTRAQCALACLEPSSSGPAQPSPTGQPPAPRRRPRFCVSWNRGSCLFPGQCIYRHVCATCQSQNHKAKDCPKTPEASVYKTRPNVPRPQPPTSVSQ